MGTTLEEDILAVLQTSTLSFEARALQIQRLVSKWHNTAKAFYRMKRSVQCTEHEKRYQKFMTLFEIEKRDIGILKHFTTNLRNSLSCSFKNKRPKNLLTKKKNKK